jgi:hypothetical protein
LASGPNYRKQSIDYRTSPPRTRRFVEVMMQQPVRVISNAIAFRRVVAEATLVCVRKDHILPSERTVRTYSGFYTICATRSSRPVGAEIIHSYPVARASSFALVYA